MIDSQVTPPTAPLTSSPAVAARATRLVLGLVRRRRTLLGLVLVGVMGCSSGPQARGPRATDVNAEVGTPDYWWDKPAPAKVSVPDFDRAMVACQATLREKFFEVDRLDARAGVITTKPLTAAQWFEPWRRDNSTVGDVMRSSSASYRRTVRFEITKTPEGRFTIASKVLVERESIAGRRLGGVLGFESFTSIDQTSLTARTDEGAEAPALYWYSVGRDYNLEVDLLDAVVEKMY